jgi:putative methyltransferase (TIGR04325 family)
MSGTQEKIIRFMRVVQSLPIIRPTWLAIYKSQFARNRSRNLFFGVFENFEAAARSVPRQGLAGYDNSASAGINYFAQESANEYPGFVWLQNSLREGHRKIFDLGGHVGVSFYSFRKRSFVPSDACWTVCDVPAVSERGTALAKKRDAPPILRFTSDVSELNSADVLFCSGALQYLPASIGALLASLERKPKRIIFNKTAIHPTLSYITLNSITTAFCPYRVESKERFLQQLTDAGYSMVDEWDNPGKALRLPFYPGHDIEAYWGGCFDLIEPAAPVSH